MLAEPPQIYNINLHMSMKQDNMYSKVGNVKGNIQGHTKEWSDLKYHQISTYLNLPKLTMCPLLVYCWLSVQIQTNKNPIFFLSILFYGPLDIYT